MAKYIVMCAATDEIIVGNIATKKEAINDARNIAIGVHRTGFDVPDGVYVYRILPSGEFLPIIHVDNDGEIENVEKIGK